MVDVFTGLAMVLAASQCQDEGLVLEFVFLFVALLTWRAMVISWSPGVLHPACGRGDEGTKVFFSSCFKKLRCSLSSYYPYVACLGPPHPFTNRFLNPAQCQD